MGRSLVYVAGAVALFLVTLAPMQASAGSVRIYVGPAYGYGYYYPRYRYGYYPRYRKGRYPRGYFDHRHPPRYVRRYWRGY